LFPAQARDEEQGLCAERWDNRASCEELPAKVYDKLGLADRLQLALYCLNHHVVDYVKLLAGTVASVRLKTGNLPEKAS
jgi:hypothetical protein